MHNALMGNSVGVREPLIACLAIRHRGLAANFILALMLLVTFSGIAGIAPGESTFAEKNCIACHHATPAVAQRLASNQSPRLGRNGLAVAPAWLRDFLLDGQRLKPGNAMPDVLHALPPAEKSHAAEALTHFLLSLQESQSPSIGMRFDEAEVQRGRVLYHTVGCVACHAPQEGPAASRPDLSGDAPERAPDAAIIAALATNSVPLGALERKYTVDVLAEFLRDPLATRPSGRMPSQRLTEREARSIAMYLLRHQPVLVPDFKVQGVNYEHFDGVGEKLPDFSKLRVVSAGCTTKLGIENVPHTNTTGLRFRSVLAVPRGGEYSFWTESRDGSQLFLDGKLLVDNDGTHKPTERESKVTLAAGDHQLTVTFFHHKGPAVLKVSWSGPGIEKQEIPAAALSLVEKGSYMRPEGEQRLTRDPVLVAEGRKVYAELNCAACHELDQPGRQAMPLDQLAGKSGGCLSESPIAGQPRYFFAVGEREELGKFLMARGVWSQPLTATEQVQQTMTALNCVACHTRGKSTGPAISRRAYFTVKGAADLGDEGAIPPHLNGVGAKLKPAWLEKVLFSGASVRPYMATRMPQFGEANVRVLTNAFLQADANRNGQVLPLPDSSYVNGLRLVGNEGLSCISCHVFAGHPSLGVPALDLLTAPERLNPDWFRRYLLNPPALRPGTRMPAFWPEGVAANKKLLEGDTEKQIGAIWSYLSSGQAKKNLPPGLIVSKMQLQPKTEPLIYRNFIQGGGSRAIGVGYPEKVNLAYDANQLCLALAWHGAFIDASRHWTGRGEGWQPPLGYSVVKFVDGQPLAILSTPDAPWPKPQERAPGFQFRGYVYDAQRRPHFRYEFAGVQVEDAFEPVKVGDNLEGRFRRTLHLQGTGPSGALYFRAAAGATIQMVEPGVYLIDGNLRLAFPNLAAGRKPLARAIEGKSELLIPLDLSAKQDTVVEEISW